MTYKVINIDYNYGIQALHHGHYKMGCFKIINDPNILRGKAQKFNPSSPRRQRVSTYYE